MTGSVAPLILSVWLRALQKSILMRAQTRTATATTMAAMRAMTTECLTMAVDLGTVLRAVEDLRISLTMNQRMQGRGLATTHGKYSQTKFPYFVIARASLVVALQSVI